MLKKYTISDGKLVLTLEEAEEGGFVVSSPLYPGLWTQAESLAEGARVSLAQLTRQRAQDQNALTLLIGQPLTGELAVALPEGKGLADAALLVEVPSGLPSELLTRRPDVRQADRGPIRRRVGAKVIQLFEKELLRRGGLYAGQGQPRLQRFEAQARGACATAFRTNRHRAVPCVRIQVG